MLMSLPGPQLIGNSHPVVEGYIGEPSQKDRAGAVILSRVQFGIVVEGLDCQRSMSFNDPNGVSVKEVVNFAWY